MKTLFILFMLTGSVTKIAEFPNQFACETAAKAGSYIQGGKVTRLDTGNIDKIAFACIQAPAN